jgi:hypothetical protein
LGPEAFAPNDNDLGPVTQAVDAGRGQKRITE